MRLLYGLGCVRQGKEVWFRSAHELRIIFLGKVRGWFGYAAPSVV